MRPARDVRTLVATSSRGRRRDVNRHLIVCREVGDAKGATCVPLTLGPRLWWQESQASGERQVGPVRSCRDGARERGVKKVETSGKVERVSRWHVVSRVVWGHFHCWWCLSSGGGRGGAGRTSSSRRPPGGEAGRPLPARRSRMIFSRFRLDSRLSGYVSGAGIELIEAAHDAEEASLAETLTKTKGHTPLRFWA